MSLFRTEELEQHSNRLHGEVVLSQPLSTKLFAGTLFGIVAIAAVWVSIGTYARIETVPDMLVTSVSSAKVVALQPGLVSELSVHEGQLVRKGDRLLVIRSQRGVNAEEAAEIVIEARDIALRHPQDPGALAALAEAEFDAGNDAEAISAADRAITLDPANKNALIQKGYALFRQADKSDDRISAYAAAMKPFEALNALENDHPLPLIYDFRSYAERGALPPPNARAALARAAELAPFDLGLQLRTAMMLITERKHSEARFFLAPIAASPHGGRAAEKARQLLDLLAKTPDGEPLERTTLAVDVGTPDLSD